MPQYKGTEGELISIKEAKKYTCTHIDCKNPNHNHHQVEAEFFGLKTFKKLLKECGGKPVGFRVYYGARHEDHSKDDPCELDEKDGGKFTPRLIIVPVDASGIELTGLHTARANKNMNPESGLKDMSAEDEEGKAMANGPVCPTFC